MHPDASVPADFQRAVARYEMQLIDAALAESGGHQGRAARLLGLSYHQFRGLLKKHGYGRQASRKTGSDETQTVSVSPP